MKPTLFLDIETIPAPEEYKDGIVVKAPARMSKQETISKWFAENGEDEREILYLKTSFNGGYGQICQISCAIDDGEVMSFPVVSRDAEKMMLEIFFRAVTKHLGHASNPAICGHFISGFDLPFIKHRCIVLGVEIPHWLKVNAKPWELLDTMTIWCGNKGSISQDELCAILGIDGKGDVDGSMVFGMWKEGKHQEIAEYCGRDVETVRKIRAKYVAAGLI